MKPRDRAHAPGWAIAGGSVLTLKLTLAFSYWKSEPNASMMLLVRYLGRRATERETWVGQ